MMGPSQQKARRAGKSAGRSSSSTEFVTNFTALGVSRELEEPRHKILFSDSVQVTNTLERWRTPEPGHEALGKTGFLQCQNEEVSAMEDRKLELYMRSRWATVLFALKTLSGIREQERVSGGERRREFRETLKQKIVEKMVFEILNPRLAKIMRSKTPPADAPRKIREDFRKIHPNETNQFPETLPQLHQVPPAPENPAASEEEKNPIPAKKFIKRGSSFRAAEEKHELPDKPVLPNPKLNKPTSRLELITHDVDKLRWKAENNVPSSARVFSIIGGYEDFKLALQTRGWKENPDPNSEFFDLKWTLKYREIDYDRLQRYQYVNHFQRNGELSTKVGLLHNIKNLAWFRGIDVDKFYPSSYDLADVEVPDFIEEFKLTKAESVLKSHLSRKKSIKEVGIAKIVLAMCITERRLKSLDEIVKEPICEASLVSPAEWEVLSCHRMVESKILKQKYPQLRKRIMSLFHSYRKEFPEKTDNDTAMNAKISELLQKLARRYPQFELNGSRNIWIVKPAGLSRGRGISMFSDLKKLTDFVKGKHYVAQKYIENPLIILGRKFDIRQWVLVTGWNPLTIWIYEEMYVRFGAEDYNMDMIGNKFMHLTNNSVTKHCEKEHDKIKGNMWAHAEFVNHLKSTYHSDVWGNKLQKQIHAAIVTSLQATEDVVIHRDHTFEMFGYDLMIDEKLNPWLIEVNCSPALDYSTEVTERLVKMGLEDLAKVVVDYELAPPDKRPQVPTGKWTKIYEGSKKAPQHNLSMSFANKKMQDIKCCQYFA